MRRASHFGGLIKFFRITLGQESLMSYYKTNFALVQHHKYSLSDIENMIPFEREIYVLLLSQYINDENQKAQTAAAQRRG